jgi:hypothetical protein
VKSGVEWPVHTCIACMFAGTKSEDENDRCEVERDSHRFGHDLHVPCGGTFWVAGNNA